MVRTVNPYSLALTCIFAAIQFVVVVLPLNIAIGGTGGYLPLYIISASLIGYFLGPLYGTLAAFIGTFFAGVFFPIFTEPTFSGLRYYIAVAPTSGAFVAGLIETNRFRAVPIIYLVPILAIIGLSVIASPLISASFIFLWFHLLVFLCTLLFFFHKFRNKFAKGLDLFAMMNDVLGGVTVWFLVLTSVMVSYLVDLVTRFSYFLVFAVMQTPEHTNIIIELLNSFFLSYYDSIIFVYPIETILASIVGWIFILFVTVVQNRFQSAAPKTVAVEE